MGRDTENDKKDIGTENYEERQQLLGIVGRMQPMRMTVMRRKAPIMIRIRQLG